MECSSRLLLPSPEPAAPAALAVALDAVAVEVLAEAPAAASEADVAAAVGAGVTAVAPITLIVEVAVVDGRVAMALATAAWVVTSPGGVAGDAAGVALVGTATTVEAEDVIVGVGVGVGVGAGVGVAAGVGVGVMAPGSTTHSKQQATTLMVVAWPSLLFHSGRLMQVHSRAPVDRALLQWPHGVPRRHQPRRHLRSP